MPEVAGGPRSAPPDPIDPDEDGRGLEPGDARPDEEDWRGLLLPLAGAQDALARLEAAAALASEPVRDGLVARAALAEAAGWLEHQGGAWVSAADLALRDAGLVGAWDIASHAGGAGRLAREMPATIAASSIGISAHGAAAPDDAPPPPPDDRSVGFALRLARHWRELAASVSVLTGGGGGERDPERDGLRRGLAALGRGGPVGDEEWRGWITLIGDDEGLPRDHAEFWGLGGRGRLGVHRIRVCA